MKLKDRFLLKDQINKIPKFKQRQFLLDCINKNNHIISDIKIETISSDPHPNSLLCQICNSSDFRINKNEEICNNCGLSREKQQQLKTFEKIEYIKPGSNIVKIERDGKKVSVDLNKVNLWLQDSDPFASEIKLIDETLNIIFDEKGLVVSQNIKNTCISLYLNFNSLLDKINPSSKPNFNKKAIIALCIYYGSLINSVNISIQQLSILFDVSISIIYLNNNIIKQIFQNTEYIKYMTLTKPQICQIDLSLKNRLLFNKVKNHLIKHFPELSDSITNKYYVGIVYYITNKINTIRKYTLSELSKICNVSEPTISSASKSIERFYKSKPALFKELIF